VRADGLYAYRYDALDRLTEADWGKDGQLAQGYDVDAITYTQGGNVAGLERYEKDYGRRSALSMSYSDGRLDEVTDLNDDPYGSPVQHNRSGELTRVPEPYDVRGAMYGARGLPLLTRHASADSTYRLTYRYSASGQRTYRKVEGGDAEFTIRGAGGRPIARGTVGEGVEDWIITRPGGSVIGRLGIAGGPDRRYYVKDRRGSVRKVYGYRGTPCSERDYYPFGKRLPGRTTVSSTPTEEDYTGHVLDDTTGLHYAGARYATGAFGQWTGPEPLLMEKRPKKLLKETPRLFTAGAYA
jgi:RHS repeat-associated protein